MINVCITFDAFVKALPIGGVLCQYGFDGGWGSIFYIFGILGLVWVVVWWILAASSPADHWFISAKEKEYIIEQTSSNKKVKQVNRIISKKTIDLDHKQKIKLIILLKAISSNVEMHFNV